MKEIMVKYVNYYLEKKVDSENVLVFSNLLLIKELNDILSSYNDLDLQVEYNI